MEPVPAPRRRGASGAAIATLLLVLSLTIFPASPVRADSASEGSRKYEERAAVEKSARSRFRRLEVTSLVIIFVAGGAAILWAVRRK